MSKSVGFRDLLKVPAFAGMNEIDILQPELDKKIAPWLKAFGIDTNYPVEILVNKYRDMSNKVDIGYRFVGRIRCDREYATSGLADIMERVAITGYKDPTLTRELCELMGGTVDFTAFNDGEVDEQPEEEFPTSQVEDDYKESTSLMETLEAILVAKRGTNIIEYTA